jgi:hypothetical protein
LAALRTAENRIYRPRASRTDGKCENLFEKLMLRAIRARNINFSNPFSNPFSNSF